MCINKSTNSKRNFIRIGIPTSRLSARGLNWKSFVRSRVTGMYSKRRVCKKQWGRWKVRREVCSVWSGARRGSNDLPAHSRPKHPLPYAAPPPSSPYILLSTFTQCLRPPNLKLTLLRVSIFKFLLYTNFSNKNRAI